MILAWLELVVLFLLCGACLFASAGRMSWPAGWAYLAILAAFTAGSLAVVETDLIRERAAPGPGHIHAACVQRNLA